jgi:hypothetical protein
VNADGGVGDNNNNGNTGSGALEVTNVKVFAARNKMYASVYSRSSLRDNAQSTTTDQETTASKNSKMPSSSSSSTTTDSNDNKNTQVAMDVSPGLIFYAHTAAHSILCVAPWSKIVVLLRNPIDRVYKQWLYSKTRLGLKLSLEDWMAQEMQLMHDVGLIDAAAAASAGADTGRMRMAKEDGPIEGGETASISEKEAWNKYQAVRGMPKSIGRSLYVLQLEEWINTFNEAGMNPSEEMIILLSEELEAHAEEQYSKLIQFLGLAPINVTTPVRTPAPASAQPMKDETRKILQTFFRPYNRRLEKLLKENKFKGDWGTIWK